MKSILTEHDIFVLPIMTMTFGATALPALTGDKLTVDLFRGSKLVRAGFDGANWHIVVERDIKLKDCKGREDDTWKYAYYKTSTSFETFRGFYLASEWNFTQSEMRKCFEENFNEDRRHVRLMQQRAKEVQNA